MNKGKVIAIVITVLVMGYLFDRAMRIDHDNLCRTGQMSDREC